MPPSGNTTTAERAVNWLFAALFAGLAARLLLDSDPSRQNVYLKVFVPAAEAFRARADLYAADSGFRYPPIAAWAFGLFAACGPLLGSVLWRGVNMLVLWFGLRACARAGLPADLTGGERAFVLLLALVTGVGGMNNGQANALVLGCLLLAAARTHADRPGAPAGWVATASALKVYPFAFGLVLGVLRPRLAWTHLAALAGVGLAPFLFAPADYVIAQYTALASGLAHEDRTQDFANSYRDLRLVAAACGASLPPLAFAALQALGGLAIALVAWALRRRDATSAMSFALGATLCWMLLLGPSTEKVTYQLLCVPLAWQTIAARRAADRTRRGLLGLALLLALVDAAWGPSRALQAAQPWTRCLSAFAAILVAADLALTAVRSLRSAQPR